MCNKNVLIGELLVVVLLLGGAVAHAGRDVFSVNFRGYNVVNAGVEEETTVDETESAGMGDWLTNGWLNIDCPFNGANLEESFDLTSIEGQTATMVIHSMRNGGSLSQDGIRTAPANGTGDMMDGHVTATSRSSEPDDLRFNATVSGLPWSTYDVIFYLGCTNSLFGDGEIVFNGGQPILFTPLHYDGTNFTEIVNSGDTGNYIVFENVTGDSFTVVVYGVGQDGFAHLGPNGFQIRQAAPELAANPDPADEVTDVSRDVVLSWTPGEFANTHDVYLGTVFGYVNDADRTNPLGVLANQGQNATTYDPGRLDFGQTYYWRIDEVNAPPDSTIFKGYVWNFTTEPFSYAIESVTATASSSVQGQGPENTVNGSGLDVNYPDLHSTDLTDMWLSDAGGPQPTWIQYEFDKVYKLHEMWVWNHNGIMEPMIGVGFKDVSIEYSVNGTDYTTLGTTHEFAQGTGAADYEHNTTVDFGGAAAKFVRLTANSNWVGFLDQYGLSEVRFLYIPVFAREPSPDSGAADVDVDVILGFRAGREAAKHDVYLSTDEQAVIDGTAPVNTVTEASYSTTLDVDSTYYWRVDEVNDAETPTTWQGEIWSLSTPEFLVVDDFELYNDLNPDDPDSKRIFNTWIDGYGTTTNGSIVGNDVAPFAEQFIVHGGDQSMPFSYDNSTASYSEATANVTDLQIGKDWTKGAPETLVLWIHGDLAAAGQLYVKVGSAKVLYDGDITVPMWRQWNIGLASLGINLSNITTVSIGVDGSGSGKLYVDDIALYKSAPAVASEEIWIEAEAATTIIAPFKTFDDAAASAGKYIGTVEGDGDPATDPPDEAAGPGLATYNFTVAGGTYKIWLRVIIPPGNNNSFWVHIPDATYNRTVSASGWIVMNSIPDSTEWYWKDVYSSDDGGQSVEFTLAPGSHTLLIGHREELALLDAIVITDLLD